MKWKIIIFMFIVTWKYATWISDPCPDAGKVDDYGNARRVGCLVNHGHYNYEEKSKTFNTREEADNFIKNAPQNCSDFKVLVEE